MNKSRSRSRYFVGVVCLAVVSAFQIGCSKTNEPGNESVAKATPKAPETKKAVEPPTDPGAKTEVAASKAPAFVNAHFEAPFRLMVDDKPLNSAAKQRYPSPAMYDVDNDGQLELVVGDIFGSMNVYENKGDSGGDPVWNKHYALKSADGEAIKVSNW